MSRDFARSLFVSRKGESSLFFFRRERKGREWKGKERRDSSVHPFRCPLRAGRHTRPFGNLTYRTATRDSREKSIRRFLRRALTGRRLRKAPIQSVDPFVKDLSLSDVIFLINWRLTRWRISSMCTYVKAFTQVPLSHLRLSRRGMSKKSLIIGFRSVKRLPPFRSHAIVAFSSFY